jgi:hypothetical protein
VVGDLVDPFLRVRATCEVGRRPGMQVEAFPSAQRAACDLGDQIMGEDRGSGQHTGPDRLVDAVEHDRLRGTGQLSEFGRVGTRAEHRPCRDQLAYLLRQPRKPMINGDPNRVGQFIGRVRVLAKQQAKLGDEERIPVGSTVDERDYLRTERPTRHQRELPGDLVTREADEPHPADARLA